MAKSILNKERLLLNVWGMLSSDRSQMSSSLLRRDDSFGWGIGAMLGIYKAENIKIEISI